MKSLGKFIINESTKAIKKHITDFDKQRILDADSYELNENNAFNCEVGDFVRYNGYYCINS